MLVLPYFERIAFTAIHKGGTTGTPSFADGVFCIFLGGDVHGRWLVVAQFQTIFYDLDNQEGIQ